VRPYLEKPNHKKELVEELKVKALSSNLSTAKIIKISKYSCYSILLLDLVFIKRETQNPSLQFSFPILHTFLRVHNGY
jgi:hypothetical protein